MDNQKDTKNTNLNSYGHGSPAVSNLLVHKTEYNFINKKTEKLVTALYMVTDCMDADDALKSKLRTLGVELLSDMHQVSVLLPAEKSTHVSVSLSRIEELLSFINIASTMGFMSEMNSRILHREFGFLVTELESHTSKDAHFALTLSDEMFHVEKPKADFFPRERFVKDSHYTKGQIFKKTYSPQNGSGKIPSPLSHSKGLINNKSTTGSKDERTGKILSFIKDKKDAPGYKDGLSIKDISAVFTDCGEKTIQRELNALVSKGEIKKVGAKRWSRYQAL